jgi:hypothetical protein
MQECGYIGDTQPGKGTVKAVGSGCPEKGNQPGKTPVNQGPPYTQESDGTHRSAHGQTHYDPLDEDGLFHQPLKDMVL